MKIYQGNIFYCKDLTHYESIENGYIIVGDDGRIIEVCSSLPKEYKNISKEYESPSIINYGSRLIIPAFCDIHLHSAQFKNIGLGYDISFEEWLTKYTYPAEQQYQNPERAEEINRKLINKLWSCGSMHASIMGSTDAGSAGNLMKLYSKSGMCAYIGKMNADVGAFGNKAEDYEKSIQETKELIGYAKDLPNVTYCISPEFVPNCSDALMKSLGELAKENKLPVQSHLSEGESDVKAVKERFPSLSYSGVYDRFQLFGQTPTIMAHSIYLTSEERQFMRNRNVTIAHCPVAISNIPSGKTMPLREFVEDGVNIGLGSDIGGGHTVNMMRIIEQTVHYSKFQQFIDGRKPFSIIEAYALATVGGGKVFGRVGSFQPGYTFEGLIIDDDELSPASYGYSIRERVERFLYEGDEDLIQERYCCGKKIEKPFTD